MMGMSWELKLMIVTAIFVADWIIVSFFKGVSINNERCDKATEEYLKKKGSGSNEESIHNTDK